MNESQMMTAGTREANSARVRLAAVAALGAQLPERSAADLVGSTLWGEWPAYAPTMIVPGLFQGGTEDDDVLSVSGDDFRRRGGYPFDAVVTLYASAQPAPWGVEEMRFGFLDSTLRGKDIEAVIRAAGFAYDRWLDGAQVLVRCQAGVNRSGLVTALVLTMAGLSPSQAIAAIRGRRGAACLMNEHFVQWLLAQGEDAAAPYRSTHQHETGSADAARAA